MIMKLVKNGARFLFVTGGIILLTSLGIDASQYLSGSSSALGILADRATEGGCPVGMSFVENGVDDFCIDSYEVSPSKDCSFPNPGHSSQSADNISRSNCFPESKSDALPWTHVTYHQAVELCGKVGKRLPLHAEWYKAALGTNEDSCLVDASVAQPAGNSTSCVSSSGSFDMVGNVWEWIEAEAVDGQYNNRLLPPNGFVANADSTGVATETNEEPQPTFHEDYFWSNEAGVFTMMRGGFYGSGDDAGLYSVHADIQPNFSGAAIGFRCVMSAS